MESGAGMHAGGAACFEVQAIPGKGMGAIAIRAIKLGERVLAEKALFVLHLESLSEEAAVAAVEALGPDEQRQFFELCQDEAVYGCTRTPMRIFQVAGQAEKNRFRAAFSLSAFESLGLLHKTSTLSRPPSRCPCRTTASPWASRPPKPASSPPARVSTTRAPRTSTTAGIQTSKWRPCTHAGTLPRARSY
jgi:hypothetical protein